jgi:hypothetical protein
MSMRWRVCVFAILLSLDCQAQEKAPKLDRMPAALERDFALSAAPPHLRDKATVYLLDPAKGYVVDRQGTNGISCVVVRTDWQFTAPLRDDVFWAVCFDAEGSKTLLQDYLYAAELRARGGDARSVHAEVTRRFGTPTSPNPSRTGVAYMIAPIMRGYTSAPTPVTMNMPHYMFYAPNLKSADIGGGGFSKEYPFMLSMSPGRDDFIIMLAGETETSKIIQDSKDLLDRLCSYHSYLCTNAGTRARTPVDQTPE